MVFPHTAIKSPKDINSASKEADSDRLLWPVNPFLHHVEAWGFHVLAQKGKEWAQEVIFDNGYAVTYAVLRFSALREDYVALKTHICKWKLHTYRVDPVWYNQGCS